jgi:hypothetical protein
MMSLQDALTATATTIKTRREEAPQEPAQLLAA